MSAGVGSLCPASKTLRPREERRLPDSSTVPLAPLRRSLAVLLARRPRPPGLSTLCRPGDVSATTGWSRVPIPTPRGSYVSSFRRCGTSSKCSAPTPHTHRRPPPTAARLSGGRKCKRRRGRCRARRLCQCPIYVSRGSDKPGTRSTGGGGGGSGRV